MSIPKSEVKIERIRGQGPGGQNRNKVASCVRLTHIPTGIQATKDGRDQHKNLKMAWKELETRVSQLKEEKKAAIRKDRRDKAIHDETVIRTYDFKKKRVKDHRTKKSADLDSVLYKGRIDLLR